MLRQAASEVCLRWRRERTGFTSFLADLGERPDGAVLTRIDPDRPYEPGNVRWGPPRHPAGERNGAATLTAEDVREIRRLAGAGTPRRVIAERFEIVPRHVGRIVRREAWGHVE
jgi:hypothetical protein